MNVDDLSIRLLHERLYWFGAGMTACALGMGSRVWLWFALGFEALGLGIAVYHKYIRENDDAQGRP